MSDATKAVFVSYAREDTDAARRIAEALRSHGVEVWFDQNELRGGDAWDGKIKKQIRECALFLAVVSAQTQERTEGYFRREWKLAVERTHDMAAGVAFIVPVVVDTTLEANAAVPEEFMKVQWTRLPGALPSPQFVEQIKRLLEAPRKPATGPRTSAAPSASPVASPRSTAPLMVVGLVAVIAIAAALYFALRPAAKDPTSTAKPVAAALPVAPVSAAPAPVATTLPSLANDKSIAVLPFTNMSEDKESGFFADGVQEDILTNLALIQELRVVSRTSVAQYRDTKKTMRDIGKELGATYLLEGSVRRASGSVRVTVQLIRATNDEHVWAQKYDRELKDIFALQSALATEIAGVLQAKISPDEQKLIARRPTENSAAYELYLKARRIRDSARNQDEMVKSQIALLEAAVVLDRNFALAWGDLGWCHGWFAHWNPSGNDATPERRQRATLAIETAVRLAPNAPETQLNVGYYQWFIVGDYERAAQEFEKLLQANPNYTAARFGLAFVQRGGDQSLSNALLVARQDPANGDYFASAVNRAQSARRYEELTELLRREVQRNPEDLQLRLRLALTEFYWRGATQPVDAFFASLSEAAAAFPQWLAYRRDWALIQGKIAEAVQRVDRMPKAGGEVDWLWAIRLAAAQVDRGDDGAVSARLAGIAKSMEASFELARAAPRVAEFAMIQALLGNKEEALRRARETVDSRGGISGKLSLVFVLARTGAIDEALKVCAELLALGPTNLRGFTRASLRSDYVPPFAVLNNVFVMKNDPLYAPLRRDPRFEALLNDPKNNEPLF